jgi:hypothetical protein
VADKLQGLKQVRSGDVTINSDVCSAGSFSLHKIGNAIFIDGFVTLEEATAGNGALLFTLPNGFKPVNDAYFRAYASYRTTGNGFYQMKALTNGQVITATGGSTFSGQIFFPCVVV